MATKPTKTARWATDLGRALEPSSGQKDTGWEFSEKPPARFFNWLGNVAYQWFAWFDERADDGGGGAPDFDLHAVDGTGTDADGGTLGLEGGDSTGDGGSKIEFRVAQAGQGGPSATVRPALLVATIDDDGKLKPGEDIQGTDAAAGTDNAGGTLGLAGGESTGDAGSLVEFKVAKAGQGSGSTVRQPAKVAEFDDDGKFKSTEGIEATGGASGVSGIKGTGGANGIGIEGVGTGTGAALSGVAADGHGAIVESDTSSPAKAALRIVPQDTDPSVSPVAGDAYVHSATGKLQISDGTGFLRYMPNALAAAPTSDAVSNTVVETAFAAKYQIPAGALRVGSVIRVRAGLQVINDAGGGTVIFRVRLGGTSGRQVVTSGSQTLNAGDDWLADADIVFGTVGATANPAVASVSYFDIGGTTTPSASVIQEGVATPTIDTTGALDVEVTVEYSVASATNLTRLASFVVNLT
jgi:hypothetical protein